MQAGGKFAGFRECRFFLERMIMFENYIFLLGLLALVPLALLFVGVLRWKRKTRKALGDEQLINALTAGYSHRLYKLKFVLVAIALALGVLAMANLRKPKVGSTDTDRIGIDVMIALDVSKSMLSEDVKPSRLEKAKQCVSMLIDGINNNRIGLVLFAGQAFLQMPLTSDIAASKLYLSSVSTDAVAVQGTNISSALQLCANSLDTKEKKYKAIVLISDGEDHDPGTKDILQQLYDNGVVVYTIGIGTAAGAPILEDGNVYKTDINGKTVISRLDEEMLKLIAEKTGGNYFHLDNSALTAGAVAAQLNSMDKKLLAGNGGARQYTAFFPYFIALMWIVLVAELFIPETKKRWMYGQ